jgi:mannosyltransferase OCH1-like enzyme
MIPKIIHYCWFGKKRMPSEIINCLTSWKKILPDYEIIEWNETNSELSHPFVNYFLEQKKWAFVSDYIRLKVLYEYGGIYLDTDMLMVKKLDNLLSNALFFGAENALFINASIIGSEKKNVFIKECIEQYDQLNYRDSLMEITIPKVITSLFFDKYKISNFDSLIEVDKIKIFPQNYFYPFPISEKLEQHKIQDYIKSETYAIHLWLGSWVDNQEFMYLRNGKYILGLKKIVANNNKKIDFKYIKKILSCLKESLKIKAK